MTGTGLWRRSIVVFVVALAVRSLTAIVITHPGYMDAYYYFHVASHLASGDGLTERLAWNFLDSHQYLPRPASGYWPASSSVLAAAGMAPLRWLADLLPGVAGWAGWRGAQIGFVLASALHVTLAFVLAVRFAPAGRLAAPRHRWPSAIDRTGRRAWLVAGLMLFSGVYFPYWVTTDTFTPFGLVGTAGLALSAALVAMPKRRTLCAVGAGALAGLSIAIRPDGPLLLVAPLVAIAATAASRHHGSLVNLEATTGNLESAVRSDDSRAGRVSQGGGGGLFIQAARVVDPPEQGRQAGGDGLSQEHGPFLAPPAAPHAAYLMSVLLLGALAGAAPWLLRNLLVWGTLGAPGTSTALWLTNYDALFAFTPEGFDAWLAAGWPAALAVRGRALVENALVLAHPVLFYLAPVAALGVWRLRRCWWWWPVMAYVMGLWLVDSLVFPFQSVRGGLFHSLGAVLPFVFMATACGVETLIDWGAQRRGWPTEQAQRVFFTALVVLQLVASVYFLVLLTSRWNATLSQNRAVAAWLDEHVPLDARVMVIDPPGFWYASGRECIAIPSDGFAALIAASATFDAPYLVVQPATPRYLIPVYRNEAPAPDLVRLAVVGEAQIYRISGANFPAMGRQLDQPRV